MNQQIIFLLIQNFLHKLYISPTDEVCQNYGSKKQRIIKCWKNNKLTQNNDQDYEMKLASIGKGRVCSLIETDQIIKCKKWNGEIEEQSLVDKIAGNGKLRKLVIEEDFICTQNLNSLFCTNELLNEVIPQNLKTGNGILILEVTSNLNTICVQYQSIIFNFECQSTTDSKLLYIPNSIKYFNASFKQILSIGHDTGCIKTKLSLENTSIVCWGECSSSMCNIPTEIQSSDKILSLKVGKDHICTIMYLNSFDISIYHSGYVTCWGSNSHGQSTVPDSYFSFVREIEAGMSITCGLKVNGHVECWGRVNEVFYELNNQLLKVSVGGRHSCGSRMGWQECWGSNEFGQLELGVDNSQQSAYQIAAGWDYTCQQHDDVDVRCVGFNQQGQTDFDQNSAIKGLRDDQNGFTLNQNVLLRKIDSGLSHSCIVQWKSSIGKVACWGGQNEYGQLDIPTDTPPTINNVTVGHEFTCISYFSYSTQYCLCFGSNKQGQSESKTTIEGYITEISAGGAHACYISQKLQEKSMSCWGNDAQGQSSVPKDYSKNVLVKRVSAGDRHTCIIVYGVVECWGMVVFNIEDQFNVMDMSTEQETLCIVDDDNIGKCYGDDEWGQCTIPVYDKVKD